MVRGLKKWISLILSVVLLTIAIPMASLSGEAAEEEPNVQIGSSQGSGTDKEEPPKAQEEEPSEPEKPSHDETTSTAPEAPVREPEDPTDSPADPVNEEPGSEPESESTPEPEQEPESIKIPAEEIPEDTQQEEATPSSEPEGIDASLPISENPLFEAGYARILKNGTVIFSEKDRDSEKLAELKKGDFVYVSDRPAAGKGDKDRLRIWFAYERDIFSGWIGADQASPLAEEDVQKFVEDALERPDCLYYPNGKDNIPLPNPDVTFEPAQTPQPDNGPPDVAEQEKAETPSAKDAATVTLNKSSITIYVDGTYQLSATVAEGIQDRTIAWSSDKTNAASVDKNGLIRGVAPGTATITAEIAGGYKAACTVKVVLVAAKKIAFYPSSLKIEKGKSSQLTVVFTPENTTNKALSWKTSNKKVATVDANGLLTAVGIGKVTITATTKDGSKKSAKLTVYVVVLTQALSISGAASVTSGSKVTMSAAFVPINVTSKTLEWSSSNPNAATVDSKGVVTAKSVAQATDVIISATTKDGTNLTAEHRLTVLPKVIGVSILLNNQPTSSVLIDLAVSKTMQLSASLTPPDASQLVNWSTSDKKVARVDTSGLVTGIKAGNATITATAKDGSGRKTACKVSVTVLAKSLSIMGPTSLTSGNKAAMKALVLPTEARNKAVTWVSSDQNVAAIDSNGVVKAKAVEDVTPVTITATTKDGTNISTNHRITILPRVTKVSITLNGKSTSAATVYLGSGGTLQLGTMVEPEDAAQAVVWSSSNTSIIRVSADGTLTGRKKGSVTVTATATDGSRKAASIRITVVNDSMPEIRGASLMPSTSAAYTGEAVTWTASAAGGIGEYSYRFELYKGDDKVTVREYEAQHNWTYAVQEPGTYVAKVTVRDAFGHQVEAQAKSILVCDVPCLNSVVTNLLETYTGGRIAWTAAASGGIGTLSYRFELYKNGVKIGERDFQADNTYACTAGEAGSYAIKAQIRDELGTQASLTSASAVVYPVLELSSVNASVLNAYVGDRVQWTALAGGGKGVLSYRFELYMTGVKIAEQVISPSREYAFTPGEPGAYSVKAFVKDALGTEISVFSSAVEIKARLPLALTSIAADRQNSYTGQSITWTASGSGGRGTLSYRFELYKDGTKVGEMPFGPDSTYTFTAIEIGAYSVKAYLKDTSGTVVSLTSGNTQVYPPLELVSVEADKAATYINRNVTWTATARGGKAPLSYRFELLSLGILVSGQDSGPASSFSRTLDVPAIYNAKVYVRDALGTEKSLESGEVTARAPLSVTSVNANSSVAYVGDTVTWTAATQGGYGSSFRFELYREDVKVDESEYAADSARSFELSQSGTYSVKLYAHDELYPDEILTLTSGVLQVYPTISGTIESDLGSQAEVGAELAWNVSATGGNPPYRYRYELFCYDESQGVGEFTSADTFAFAPEQSGLFSLIATVQDAFGRETTLVSNSVLLSNPALEVTELTADKSSAKPGDSIIWTANAQGGKPGYNYLFEVLKGDALVLRSQKYAADNHFSFTPSAVGEYRTRVYVKDASANLASLSSESVPVSAASVSAAIEVNAETALVGDELQWTVSASGGYGALLYTYRLYHDGALTRQALDQSFPNFSYKPLQPGAYRLETDVRDTAGSQTTTTHSSVQVSARPILIQDITASPTQISLGNSISWTVQVTGGYEDLLYQYRIFAGDACVDEVEGGASLTYIPQYASRYRVSVTVRDAHGGSAYASSDFTKVTAPSGTPVIESVTTSAASCSIGDTIIWTAHASGAGTLSYAFDLYRDGTLHQSAQGVYESAASFTYTPNIVGTYHVAVSVQDENGTVSCAFGDPVVVTLVPEPTLTPTPTPEPTPTPAPGGPTEIVIQTPALSSKAYRCVLPLANVSVAWARVTAATYYTVKLSGSSDGSNFTGITLPQDRVTSPALVISQSLLTAGYEYRLRIQGYDAADQSVTPLYYGYFVIEGPSILTEAPPEFLAPKMVSYVSRTGEVAYPLNDITVQWRALRYATRYELRLWYYDSAYHEIVRPGGTLTGSSYTIDKSLMKPGMAYRLRVRAYNDAGVWLQSDERYFQIEGDTRLTQLESPELISPVFALRSMYAECVETYAPIALQWTEVPAAQYYSIVLYSTASSTEIAVPGGDLIPTNEFALPLSVLTSGEKYRLDIRAHHDADCFEESESRYFVAPYPGGKVLKCPVLTSHAFSTTTEDLPSLVQQDLALAWEPVSAAVRFRIELQDQDQDGEYSGAETYWATAPAFSVPLGHLTPDRNHRLRITAYDQQDHIMFSPWYYFRVAQSTITSPLLITPALAMEKPYTNLPLSALNLAWNDVTNAVKYQVSLWEWYDGDYDPIYKVKDILEPRFTIPKSELYQGGAFRLYIGAEDQYGNYKHTIYNFTIGDQDYVELDKTEWQAGCETGSRSFNVFTLGTWSASVSDGSWISVSPASGTGTKYVKVSIAGNAGSSARTGTVKFRLTGSSSYATYSITQAAGSQAPTGPLTITYPIQGAVCPYADMQLAWTEYKYDMAYYRAVIQGLTSGQVAYDSDDDSDILLPYVDVDRSVFSPGHSYRLTVYVYNAQYQAIAQASAGFTVAGSASETPAPTVKPTASPTPVPGSFDITCPTSGAVLPLVQLAVKWTSAQFGATYRIALRDLTLYPGDVNTTPPAYAVNETVQGKSCYVDADRFVAGHEYRLWIGEYNLSGALLAQATRQFSIAREETGTVNHPSTTFGEDLEDVVLGDPFYFSGIVDANGGRLERVRVRFSDDVTGNFCDYAVCNAQWMTEHGSDLNSLDLSEINMIVTGDTPVRASGGAIEPNRSVMMNQVGRTYTLRLYGQNAGGIEELLATKPVRVVDTPYIRVTNDSGAPISQIDVNYSGSSGEYVYVSSNIDGADELSITCSGGWYIGYTAGTVSQNYGMRKLYCVIADPNPLRLERSGSLIISGGGVTKTIGIRQAANPNALTVEHAGLFDAGIEYDTDNALTVPVGYDNWESGFQLNLAPVGLMSEYKWYLYSANEAIAHAYLGTDGGYYLQALAEGEADLYLSYICADTIASVPLDALYYVCRATVRNIPTYRVLLAGTKTGVLNEDGVDAGESFCASLRAQFESNNYKFGTAEIQVSMYNNAYSLLQKIDSYANVTKNSDVTYICTICHGYDGGISLWTGGYIADGPNKGKPETVRVSYATLFGHIANIKGKIVYITGTCHSGSAISEAKKHDARITVIAASSAQDVSLDNSGDDAVLQMGSNVLFIDGMLHSASNGDINMDGLITTGEAFDYARAFSNIAIARLNYENELPIYKIIQCDAIVRLLRGDEYKPLNPEMYGDRNIPLWGNVP